MHHWNVVVSLRSNCYPWARQRLREYARVDRTDYYNILALRVEDPDGWPIHYLVPGGAALRLDGPEAAKP